MDVLFGGVELAVAYDALSLSCAGALRLLSMLPKRANREQVPTRDWWTPRSLA